MVPAQSAVTGLWIAMPFLRHLSAGWTCIFGYGLQSASHWGGKFFRTIMMRQDSKAALHVRGMRDLGASASVASPSSLRPGAIGAQPGINTSSGLEQLQPLEELSTQSDPGTNSSLDFVGKPDQHFSDEAAIKPLLHLQKGLEGYSQSLVFAPGAESASGLSSRSKVSLLHREACKRALDTYIDPESGFEVFTAHHLRTRECCGSTCRHCPWGHRNVPGKKSNSATEQIVQRPSEPEESLGGGDSCSERPTRPLPKSTLYTRKGDAGYTNLYNESWILKSEPIYEAIGDVDELNSAVGVAHALLLQEKAAVASELETVQAWLLDIGSSLCTPRPTTANARKLQRTRGVQSSDVAKLESFIDAADDKVAKLRNFILPGGSPAAAALHIARTVCRRAERHTWPLILANAEQGHDQTTIGIFLNRLSDYLFVAARLAARSHGSPERQYRIERQVDRWQRQIVETETTPLIGA